MKFLKNLFRKEEEKEVQEIEKEVENFQQSNFNEEELICDYCGFSIGRNQKVKTFGGKKYHLKPCWKRIRNDAKKINRGVMQLN